MARELEFGDGFAARQLEAVWQLAAVRIDKNDMFDLAYQGSILNLQLVAVFNPPVERCLLLYPIEKSPTEAVIAAAAVADTHQKGLRFEAAPSRN